MRRAAAIGTVALCCIAGSASAQDDRLTKREVIERASVICDDMARALRPHARRMERAANDDRPRAMVRHGRRWVDAARRPIRRLAALQQEGHDRYRRFVVNLRGAFSAFDAGLDAFAAGRYRPALRRLKRADRRIDRAIGAGRRYGLRRPCVSAAPAN